MCQIKITGLPSVAKMLPRRIRKITKGYVLLAAVSHEKIGRPTTVD